MARYVERIDTSLTQEAAFAYMASFENFEAWDPGVKASRQVAGSGPGLGAAYDVTVSGAGRPLVLRYEVVEYRAPARVVVKAETARLRSVDTVTVSPRQGGSSVTYEATFVLRGVLAAANPLFAILFRRIAKRAGAGLRQALTEQQRP